MVQGHVFDTLLSPRPRADALYQLQPMLHGSTAPGFLFASGFVAGLPRAPLSLTASLRRARRLLFVLGVGYALHLPVLLALEDALEATPAERAALFACDALQVDRGDAAPGARPAVAGRPALDAGGRVLAARARGRARRLGVRRVARACPLPWAPTSTERRPVAVPGLPLRRVRARGHGGGSGPRPPGPGDAGSGAARPGASAAGAGRAAGLVLRGRGGLLGRVAGLRALRLGGLLLLLRVVEALAARRPGGMRPRAARPRDPARLRAPPAMLYGGVVGGSAAGPGIGTLGFAQARRRAARCCRCCSPRPGPGTASRCGRRTRPR